MSRQSPSRDIPGRPRSTSAKWKKTRLDQSDSFAGAFRTRAIKHRAENISHKRADWRFIFDDEDRECVPTCYSCQAGSRCAKIRTQWDSGFFATNITQCQTISAART